MESTRLSIAFSLFAFTFTVLAMCVAGLLLHYLN
jgi:hypothetical protein